MFFLAPDPLHAHPRPHPASPFHLHTFKVTDIATLTLFQDDETGEWSVDIKNAKGGSFEGEADYFPTAGDAVNFILKWAKDRKLHIDVDCTSWTAKRVRRKKLPTNPPQP